MSAVLADAISRLVADRSGASTRRGTVVDPTTVELAGGALIAVTSWAGAPAAGRPCWLLIQDGAVLGIAEGGGSSGGDYLPLTGGTLTGDLTLAGDPTVPMHAATKRYADPKRIALALNSTITLASSSQFVTFALSTDPSETGNELSMWGGAGGSAHLLMAPWTGLYMVDAIFRFENLAPASKYAGGEFLKNAAGTRLCLLPVADSGDAAPAARPVSFAKTVRLNAGEYCYFKVNLGSCTSGTLSAGGYPATGVNWTYLGA